MDKKLVFGVGALGTVLLIACTQDATRPDLPSTRGNPQRVEVIGPDGTTSAALTNGECEDIGAVDGAATVTVESSFQHMSWVAADRPQPAKVTVIAALDASIVNQSVALGAGVNANYETCTQCLLIAIGCGASCSKAAFFYPRSGTATITGLASDRGTFQGHLENAELVQVTIDSSSQHSTPVPNGACMKVRSLSFKGTATAQSTGTGSSSGNTSASSSGTGSSSGGTVTNPDDGLTAAPGAGSSSGGAITLGAGSHTTTSSSSGTGSSSGGDSSDFSHGIKTKGTATE